MRNLPESRHAPVTPCFRNFDRLNAVQPRQGRVRATRRSSVSAPGNGIKRSTTIRTLPHIAQTGPPHTGATCGDTSGVGHTSTLSRAPVASLRECAAGEAEGCSGGCEGSGSGAGGGSSGTTGGGGGSPGPGVLGSGVGRCPPRTARGYRGRVPDGNPPVSPTGLHRWHPGTPCGRRPARSAPRRGRHRRSRPGPSRARCHRPARPAPPSGRPGGTEPVSRRPHRRSYSLWTRRSSAR